MLPDVGKTIVAEDPEPTEGVPEALKLQLYVYPGTPYNPVVEAVIDPPAQTVVAERLKGVATLLYWIVFPMMVMVHGEAAPIQVLLHPAVPQHERKNCIVKLTGTATQLGAGRHVPTSLKMEILVPVQVPALGRLQNQ